jgi:CheY-like chemotaxis protein
MFQSPERPRVLIADGYADAADSLALVLSFWGFDTRIAYSGSEALLLARRYRPHIAILELRLDGIDGFRLANRLRQVDPDITLITVTSRADAASRRRSRAAGFTAHLIKPVEPERLRRMLVGPGGPCGGDGELETGCRQLEGDTLGCEWGELFERYS